MFRTFVASLAVVAVACGSGGGADPGDAAQGDGARRFPKPDDGAPPVVTVESPAPEALARPAITVSATCTSGGGQCASLTLGVVYGGVVLTGTRSLSAEVDLSAWDGRLVELVFTGVDRAGRSSEVRRFVYVESSPSVSVVATAPGPIWDYAEGRILFVDLTGTTPVLRLRDVATGATEALEASDDVVGTWGCYGYVTPSGAIYAHGERGTDVYPYCWGHEWRDGASVELGGLNSCASLRVAGPYASFSTQSAVDGATTLVRRDLRTGANVEISTAAGNWMNDVAANGDVVYWASPDVYRWSEGVSVPLTGDSPGSWNAYPVTDGSSVVYRRTNPADSTHALVLHDGRGEVELHPAEAGDPVPPWDYAIANGWVAYTRAGSTEVWRHAPGGEELVADLGGWNAIDAVAPDGTVLFTSGSRRYRSAPGMALQDVGAAMGTIVHRAGRFYAIVGGTVLEVN